MSGLRAQLMDVASRSVALADLRGSTESTDAIARVNCGGFGRTRVFRDFSMHLPSRRRQLLRTAGRLPYSTQTFQLAGCNWSCWYCFVDDHLLDPQLAPQRLASADDLVTWTLAESPNCVAIDLSGGQPDLVPEWAFWVAQEIESRGLRGKLGVWVDDNLSGSFLRTYLSPRERHYLANFPGHTRACCFKGYSPASFSFNTGQHEGIFDVQFRVARELLEEGFDCYFYVTFTGPHDQGMRRHMNEFFDRLQEVHRELPLRVIPLRIKNFAAVRTRAPISATPLSHQFLVNEAWQEALRDRFSEAELARPYEEIRLS